MSFASTYMADKIKSFINCFKIETDMLLLYINICCF